MSGNELKKPKYALCRAANKLRESERTPTVRHQKFFDFIFGIVSQNEQLAESWKLKAKSQCCNIEVEGLNS